MYINRFIQKRINPQIFDPASSSFFQTDFVFTFFLILLGPYSLVLSFGRELERNPSAWWSEFPSRKIQKEFRLFLSLFSIAALNSTDQKQTRHFKVASSVCVSNFGAKSRSMKLPLYCRYWKLYNFIWSCRYIRYKQLIYRYWKLYHSIWSCRYIRYKQLIYRYWKIYHFIWRCR